MLKHPYHLVDISPWPFLISLALLSFAFNLVNWLVHYNFNILIQLLIILLIIIQWWRDVIRESQSGYHTDKVQKGILIGYLLFLITEIMLFGSFFWAFFHSSLSPAIELGVIWPPKGINPIDPWMIPLLGS